MLFLGAMLIQIFYQLLLIKYNGYGTMYKHNPKRDLNLGLQMSLYLILKLTLQTARPPRPVANSDYSVGFLRLTITH